MYHHLQTLNLRDLPHDLDPFHTLDHHRTSADKVMKVMPIREVTDITEKGGVALIVKSTMLQRQQNHCVIIALEDTIGDERTIGMVIVLVTVIVMDTIAQGRVARDVVKVTIKVTLHQRELNPKSVTVTVVIDQL